MITEVLDGHPIKYKVPTGADCLVVGWAMVGWAVATGMFSWLSLRRRGKQQPKSAVLQSIEGALLRIGWRLLTSAELSLEEHARLGDVLG